EELEGRITIGVLVDRELPIYTQEYEKIREEARQRFLKRA
ncbi:2-oxoglutarate ferredoxin oxidoreductase subunit beta, partial [Thermodesulforhabdus norvegica]